DVLDPGSQQPRDQREQQTELEQEQEIRTEAASPERLRRHALPQKERRDGNHPPEPAEEVEGDQDADRRERDRARGIEDAEAHRRLTTPSRGSSTATKSRTSASVGIRA